MTPKQVATFTEIRRLIFKIVEFEKPTDRALGSEDFVRKAAIAVINSPCILETCQKLTCEVCVEHASLFDELTPQSPKPYLVTSWRCCLDVVRRKQAPVGLDVVEPRTTPHALGRGMSLLDVLKHCPQLSPAALYPMAAESALAGRIPVLKMDPHRRGAAEWIGVVETPEATMF